MVSRTARRSEMKSKLHKLRQVGFDELRVRGSQAFAAFAERQNWSSSSKLISDDALLRLLDGEISDLLTHFRERTSPKFFASFADPQATINELRRRWPGAENQIVKRAERILAGYFDLLGFRDLSFGTRLTGISSPSPANVRPASTGVV